jgi:hypothetical protein
VIISVVSYNNPRLTLKPKCNKRTLLISVETQILHMKVNKEVLPYEVKKQAALLVMSPLLGLA